MEFEVLEYPNSDCLLYLLGSECSKLLFDGKCVWNYVSGPYPTSLYFKSSGFLYLNFDPYYYLYVYDGKSWVLKKDLSHRPSAKLDPSMYPKDITIITEKTEESLKLVNNDTSLYNVYDHGNGMLLYVFTPNARCVEVKYRDQTVSKRQPGAYPTRILFDTESLTFEYDFQKTSAIYRLSDSGWYLSDAFDKLEKIESEIPSWIAKQSNYKFGSRISLSKLKIFTSDNRNGSGAKLIHLKSSMLHCNKWNSGYFYPVNGLYLKLVYNGHVVFRSTEYPYRGRPTVVLFDLDNNTVTVFFSSNFKVSINHIDDTDKETVLVTKRETKEPDAVTEPSESVSEPIISGYRFVQME
ncbi:hypothetical protein TpMuguga_01g01224 [Theileria parva strain Muguga]|uniref:Uncharacterized protein n=1 Tax=Theileria parva TaxID=5875 RepID=Q4N6E6_THEPA|nr:uncharacterized protein TpMuguga_01g01224 [Theileria parva strain Muguga]EAN34462.1 hypothetical protein TpMuguga_01g01224 [Theileria parva strain Muguga]|eukprot:XP_766745.1 hypothetical protein [Theileria parva strain Muguga]